MTIRATTIRNIFRSRLITATLALALSISAASASATPAQEVVDRFHGSLLDVMKRADALGFEGRYEQLDPVLTRSFNMTVMTRVVAGRFWRSLNTEERKRLVAAFSRMTIATYAARFDGYGGETFQVSEEVPVRDKTVLVKSQLKKTDGETIALNYLVRQFADRWQVIDIFLKGAYSELATKRSEYTAVLKRQGLDGLVQLIEQKTAAFKTNAN